MIKSVCGLLRSVHLIISLARRLGLRKGAVSRFPYQSRQQRGVPMSGTYPSPHKVPELLLKYIWRNDHYEIIRVKKSKKVEGKSDQFEVVFNRDSKGYHMSCAPDNWNKQIECTLQMGNSQWTTFPAAGKTGPKIEWTDKSLHDPHRRTAVWTPMVIGAGRHLRSSREDDFNVAQLCVISMSPTITPAAHV